MVTKFVKFVFETVQVIVFAATMFLFVYILLAQPHKIRGASMEPNFFDSEYLLTDKVSYRLGEPSRGDVIVFKAPPSGEDEFIKRIIGLPGETIEIQDEMVFINGQKLMEPYLARGVATKATQFMPPGEAVVVPNNSFFVLGDNRNHSLDSRTFGFIKSQMITGKAWFVYWPPDLAGAVAEPEFSF